jgi:nucleotide-binding universal stress UspA family protein
VLLGCLWGQQSAFAQEYRQVEWADGRVWAVEIMETTTEGMRVRMVQGEAMVPYAEIQALVPLDEVGFQGAPPWKVELLPLEAGGDEALRTEAKEVFEILRNQLEQMGGVESLARRKVTRGAPRPVVEDCGIPSTVSVEERKREGVDHIVLGHLHRRNGEGRVLTLCALSTAGSRPLHRLEIEGVPGLEVAQVQGGLFRVLGLEPSGDALEVGANRWVSEPTALPPEDPVTPAQAARAVDSLAFVPLPGFPSLVARDMERFGWAWAVVVPGTIVAGLWVAEAGFTPGQVLFLTGAAYYTLTVAVNRYFGDKTGAEEL